MTWRFAILFTVVPFAYGDDSPSDTGKDRAAQQRAALQQLEADPARLARLIQELRTFQDLSPEQQNRLRKLDKELHEGAAAHIGRLNRSLVRYVEWLEGLPPPKRNYIESVDDPGERLRRIRQLREQEWIEGLPKAHRDQVQAATGETRNALIKKLKLEEKQRRHEWQTAVRHWDELQKGSPPTSRSEMTNEAQTFIEKVLYPRLTGSDKERLNSAEGNWPLFMETLVELSDRYVPFPGAARPKEPSDLPEEIRKRINNLPPARQTAVRAAEGRWPDYPQAILVAMRRPRGVLTPKLTPAKPADFDEPLQVFIKTQLVPRLSADEQQHLTKAEGAWPDYSRALVQLAAKHNLIVPGMLPMPKSYLDKYRSKPEKQ